MAPVELDIGGGRWKALFTTGRWTFRLRDAHTESPIVCLDVVHLLRHDRSTSPGHDGGVAIAVLLNEVRLAELSTKESDKPRLQVFLADPCQRRFGEVQGHSVIEAEPRLKIWRRAAVAMAPRLYHGTRSRHTTYILQKYVGLGCMSGPRRTHTISSARLSSQPPRYGGGGDSCGSAGPYDSEDNNYRTLTPQQFDSEDVVVGVYANIAVDYGSLLYLSTANSTLCKQLVSVFVLLNLVWAGAKATHMRCGAPGELRG